MFTIRFSCYLLIGPMYCLLPKILDLCSSLEALHRFKIITVPNNAIFINEMCCGTHSGPKFGRRWCHIDAR
jgi:hypothetical protein